MTDLPQAPDPKPASQPVDAEIVPDPGPVRPTPGVDAVPDYNDEGVPTLDYVRGKIEGRYTTSIGADELARETAAGRSVEVQEAERDRAAKAKLDEIRRSLGG